MRRLPTLMPLLLCLLLVVGARPRTAFAEGAVVFPDSVLVAAADFDQLRPDLLSLEAPRVAETAWALAPRLVELERPDLLADLLVFWDDRCGESEPLVRLRILAAIWDGAFDESLYDAGIAAQLDAWETRDTELLTTGRNDFDAFTVAFADQMLPHQDDGSLAEYFCLEYSGRFAGAAALLAEDQLADTWLRWYREHPEAAVDELPGGVIESALAADDADDEAGGAGINSNGPTSLLVTLGAWRPRGDVALAGDKVLVGLLLEQRAGSWFLRLPVEARFGRTTRPYLVDQGGFRASTDRFDALYLGLEVGSPVARVRRITIDLFGGLGYDGIRPFLKQDIMLAALNASLGVGLRWQAPGRPLVVGLDARREWVGPRNDTPDARDDASDSLSGGAWSLRLGAGLRFGRPFGAAGGSS